MSPQVRHSAVYRGWVHHRRHAPRGHDFHYRLFMMYLDLDELDQVFERRWLWSVGKPNVASFRRADYLGDPSVPLKDAVLDVVHGHLGRRPAGAVRMLTHLRGLGLVFNPVTFYYVFDAAGSLDAIVAEITNTPWGERHRYVVDARAATRSGTSPGVQARFPKTFHVSPFMGMDMDYAWTFAVPDAELLVHMENRGSGAGLEDGPVFDATLRMQRRPITARSLAGALLAHPAMAVKVKLAIYFQAARLWLKRVPFQTHPNRLPQASTSATGDPR